MSSQRRESTNHSIKRRLGVSTSLCDFYNIFCSVVSEWRENKNCENHKCSKGNVEMAFPLVTLLKRARSVCTIEAYRVFEKEFVKGISYGHDELHTIYLIWCFMYLV